VDGFVGMTPTQATTETNTVEADDTFGVTKYEEVEGFHDDHQTD